LQQRIGSDNIIVNGLWIGSELSVIELLTLRSFLAHGHRFRLWLYGNLETALPKGVEVMDANEVIPGERIFRYEDNDQFGHGKGSVSGFSDIFRYKLLYDHGGWWVDMDVTCLRPLNILGLYYFRPHHELLLVGNVMKCPKGSELMLRCYEEASRAVDEHNTDWHLPIDILVANVKAMKLEGFIVKGHSTFDRWDLVQCFLYTRKRLSDDWWFIHWMNEEWRWNNIDKHDFMIGSAYGQLLVEYGLVEEEHGFCLLLRNRVRFLWKRLKGWANA